MFWPTAKPIVLISWCAIIWMIYSALWLLCKRWQRAQPDDMSMRTWAQPYVILAWLATAAWGAAGVLFFHTDSFVYQSLLFVVLIIGAAAITATSTAYSPTFYSVALLLLPLIIRLLFESDNIYKLLATGLFVFGVMLFFLHRNSHAFYAASLKQNFINEELASELALQKDIAEQANVSKSKFLAMASHDLRQPLQALNLFLGELKLLANNPKKNKELIHNMEQSISGMNDLFDGLMDVSRFEAGVVNVHLKNFVIDELLNDLRDEYSVRTHTKVIEFHCLPCNALVRSDPLLLRRIIRNLLENAFRYTLQGRILLGCRRKDDFICVQVLDTGVGIEEKNINNIFNEFQQLNNPEGDKNKGIGLGLTVVRQLAGVLKHDLHVESVVNKGTMFSLKIPLASMEGEAIKPGKNIDCLKGSRVGLIADTQHGFVIKDFLCTWGCHVVCKTDFDNVKNILISLVGLVDVIVIDGCFVNDEEVSAFFKIKKEINIPVILITESENKILMNEIKKNKINVLNKPFNPVQLATLLRFVLTEKIDEELVAI